MTLFSSIVGIPGDAYRFSDERFWDRERLAHVRKQPQQSYSYAPESESSTFYSSVNTTVKPG
eukprot:5009297-Amphidinium_carterae.2